MAITAALIAGGVGLAGTAAGGLISSSNASAANKLAGQTAAAGLQDSVNQQNYTKALNALAMQRSVAGSIDSRGSKAGYDPATNTWRTDLSPEAYAIQHRNDAFTQQNLKDVTQGNAQALTKNASDAAQTGAANNGAMLAAIKARGSAETARMKLDNFRPMQSGELEGALQQTATTANRQAQDPIIADTLRSMVRNGTAAAPVLTSMMRDNATSLRQTMLQDKIGALQNTATLNNTRRGGLQSTFSALDSAATPKLQFSQNGGLGSAATTDPSLALTNEIAARANAAPTTGIQAGSVSNQAAGNSNAARSLAASYTPYDNTGDMISSLTKQLAGNKQVQSGIASLFGGKGAGDAGDKPGVASKPVFGDFY